MSELKLVPAIEENFFKDRCFADQRVAGANPVQIWRVTNKEGKSLTGIRRDDLIFKSLLFLEGKHQKFFFN